MVMPSFAGIFNLLQDATVVAIDGDAAGTVRLEIDCDYLRDRLEGPGNRFFVLLDNCTRFVYRPSNEQPAEVRDLTAIALRRLWIKDADQHAGFFVVHCSEHAADGTGGNLEVAADRVSVTIDNGREISPSELDDVAEEYWSGFR